MSNGQLTINQIKEELIPIIQAVVTQEVKTNIEEFLHQSEIKAKELSLIERVIRVEEELKALKEIEKTTDPHTLDIYTIMMEDIKNFYNVIKTSLNGSGIYWETPKKGDAVISTYTEATESDLNSKLKKYQPESYLYFNSVPESPRFLVNLKNTFSKKMKMGNMI